MKPQMTQMMQIFFVFHNGTEMVAFVFMIMYNILIQSRVKGLCISNKERR